MYIRNKVRMYNLIKPFAKKTGLRSKHVCFANFNSIKDALFVQLLSNSPIYKYSMNSEF